MTRGCQLKLVIKKYEQKVQQPTARSCTTMHTLPSSVDVWIRTRAGTWGVFPSAMDRSGTSRQDMDHCLGCIQTIFFLRKSCGLTFLQKDLDAWAYQVLHSLQDFPASHSFWMPYDLLSLSIRNSLSSLRANISLGAGENLTIGRHVRLIIPAE